MAYRNRRSDESFEASRSTAPADRQRIIDFLANRGRRGLISDEAESRLSLSHQTCSARFNDLWLDAKIMRVYQRETRTGCLADVHVLPEFSTAGELESNRIAREAALRVRAAKRAAAKAKQAADDDDSIPPPRRRRTS